MQNYRKRSSVFFTVNIFFVIEIVTIIVLNVIFYCHTRSFSLDHNQDQNKTITNYDKSNDREFFLFNEAKADNTYTVVVIGIFVDEAELPISERVFKSTLKLAIKRVNSLYRPNLKFKLLLRDAGLCSHQRASAIAAEGYFMNNARSFIVSGCDEAIKSVSHMASSWRVPVMTAAGIGPELTNKTIFNTLTRVAFSFERAVEFLFKLFKSFNWAHIAMIVDETDSNSLAIRDSIQQQLQSNRHQSNYELYLSTQTLNIKSFINLNPYSESSSEKYITNVSINVLDRDQQQRQSDLDTLIKSSLRQAASFSRIILLLVNQVHIRQILLNAYNIGLADGSYTFLNVPLIESQKKQQEDVDYGLKNTNTTATTNGKDYFLSTTEINNNNLLWYRPQSKYNKQVKKAFESLMLLYVKVPVSSDYVFYVNNVTKDLKRPSRRINSAGSVIEDVSINSFTASFYDCVQIYAHAINQTLQLPTVTSIKHHSNNQDNILNYFVKNRHDIVARSMWNHTINDLLTGSIYINENGDREADYTLDDMDHSTGLFEPVRQFNGKRRTIERIGLIHWSSDTSVIGPTIDKPDCNLTSSCTYTVSRFTITVSLVALMILISMSIAMYVVHRQINIESQLVDEWWKISLDEIEGYPCYESEQHHRDVGSNSVSSVGHKTKSLASTNNRSLNVSTVIKSGLSSSMPTSSIRIASDTISVGVYKSFRVAVRPIPKLRLSRKVMMDLRMLKNLNHANLCRFMGIVSDEPHTALVLELCPKASLREFFNNETVVIDWTFKYSIMNDIIEGLNYIHNCPVEYHGRLKTTNCLVDSRFMVKLSDYGMRSIYNQIDDEDDEDVVLRKKIWTAPEHLKSSGHIKRGSKKGDIYSFGIILYEIITNERPFQLREDAITNDKDVQNKQLRDIFDKIKLGPGHHVIGSSNREPFRPDITKMNCNSDLVELVKACWHDNPTKRPDSQTTRSALRRLTKGITSKKLLENLTSRMEQYTNNLENMVNAKLQTIMEEKLKTEEILYQFVPKSLAELMKLGQTIEPEAIECVTVFYSDIVGFTCLSAQSTPIQVIDLLSDLYSCFDETLEQYDTFKVDTIGDAYIVASGLPNRNGIEHVNEIAKMAIHLRERVSKFKIKHKPTSQLQMRVGIHSGPCVAGLVGVEMPKYCLFGDTISIARFMESNGLPMKLHITEESRNLLERVEGFSITKREPRLIRDGKPMTTYWLNGYREKSIDIN